MRDDKFAGQYDQSQPLPERLEAQAAEEYVDDGAAFITGAEAELVRQLTEGEPEAGDPNEEALARLSPRWEIRIQTERDPVAEETAAYRKLAKEVDGRYDGQR
ncbi:hypothetical protein [Cohnella sp. 56]|uniref:hypothetical protein n=1 Tax=Cohnella sp. 56 TaxID=3113722 RepID=UPI0030E9BC52